MAAEMHVSPNKVSQIIKATQQPSALDMAVEEEGNTSLRDFIGDKEYTVFPKILIPYVWPLAFPYPKQIYPTFWIRTPSR